VRSLVKFREKNSFGFKLRAETMDPLVIFDELIPFVGHPAVHFVLYEALTGNNLEPSMRAIAQHLGISYSDVLTKPTQLGKPVVVGTSTQQVTQVFSNNRRWTKGLTFFQVAKVGFYYGALRAAGMLRVLPLTSYAALKDLIRLRQMAT
jgi:hypothetical protein